MIKKRDKKQNKTKTTSQKLEGKNVCQTGQGGIHVDFATFLPVPYSKQ